MMPEFPILYVISPTSLHTHTVILLHGRGSNGQEFARDLFEGCTSKGLSLQEHLPGWKWVFPTSQTRFSTMFQEEMHEWFVIHSLTDPTSREELQAEGLQRSVAFIHQVMQEEVNAVGGDAEKVVLGGISQGCATAVHALLSSTITKVGAFVGFCSWMPFPNHAQDIAGGNSNKTTPVFLTHSKDDPVVDFKLGTQLRNILQQQLGMNVTWKEYDGGEHWIKEPEGLDDLINFLAITLGSASPRT